MKATYQQLYDLSQSGPFQDRGTIAIIKYATYILGTNPSIIKANWAKRAVQSPRSELLNLAIAIVWNPGIKDIDPFTPVSSFNAITDDTFQSIVEAVIDSTVLIF